MSASGEAPWSEVLGPSRPDELQEQLAGGDHAFQEAADVDVPELAEQLQDAARPTKPSKGDAHANDPSKTTTIQRSYAQKLRGRFNAIKAAINRGVGDRDVLDLDEGDQEPSGSSLADMLAEPALDRVVDLLAEQRYGAAVEQLSTGDWDPEDLVGRDFEFERLARKHSQFMEWLRAQQQAGVLEVIERGDNTYIRAAYDRGVRNAHGFMEDPPTADVASVLRRPIHQERLELLFERNYEALLGITDDVARDVSRTLAEGLSEGVGSTEMSRRLRDRVDAIGNTRATTLARTEVMYAHNESTLNEYERWLGLDAEVQVASEVSTAGDAYVCSICTPWEGVVMTLSVARQEGPPFHPRCRCILLPVTKPASSSAPDTTETLPNTTA